jgi:hypothetical protein
LAGVALRSRGFTSQATEGKAFFAQGFFADAAGIQPLLAARHCNIANNVLQVFSSVGLTSSPAADTQPFSGGNCSFRLIQGRGYVTLPPQLPERLGPHCPFNYYLRNERSHQEFETFNVTRGRSSVFSEGCGKKTHADR